MAKKIIWNSIVILAILFLLFMFGFNYRFGPSPKFAPIPSPPDISKIEMRTVLTENLNPAINEMSVLKKLPVATPTKQIFQARSNAVAWVVRLNVRAQSEVALAKLKEQKLIAFVSPFDSETKSPVVFVGPYVKRQDAELAVSLIKNTLGFAGEVVKFDPLTM